MRKITLDPDSIKSFFSLEVTSGKLNAFHHNLNSFQISLQLNDKGCYKTTKLRKLNVNKSPDNEFSSKSV